MKSVSSGTTAAVLAFIVLLPTLMNAQETTGTIKGHIGIPTLVLPQNRPHPMRYGSSMSPEMHEESAKEPAPEVTNVVVSLEGPGLDNLLRPKSGAVLNQKDATFIPHILPIVKGTTVHIVNRDKTYHNVFSLSPAKKFDIGRRPTGEEVPVTFDKTGIVQVFCDIHSHMSAFILVLDNPVFVQPAANGTFVLDNIPPGTYTINVWHERFAAPPQTVSVKAGATSNVDFSLQ